ncbi:MAG: hypothetical protein R3D81_16610 [Thalassovita sp.]
MAKAAGRTIVTTARIFPSMQQQEFEFIYGPLFPPSRFTLPVMRKMKDDGLTEEQLAMAADQRANGQGSTPCHHARPGSPSMTF